MPGSTLGRAGAVTLPMHAGPQLTEVSARSYHNTVATLLLAADALTGSSEVLSRLAPAADAMATFLGGTDGLGERLDEFVGTPSSTSVLARGPSLATAYQGAFNLKEVARFFAEPMSAAQYRHGPIEVAAPGHLAMVMAPLGPTFTLLRKLTEELLGFGTRVMFVTDTQESLRHDGDGLCAVRHPHLDETLAPLINLIPLQLFANARAGGWGTPPAGCPRPRRSCGWSETAARRPLPLARPRRRAGGLVRPRRCCGAPGAALGSHRRCPARSTGR